jgi:2-dehydropantoate 2-reductase
MHILIVGAGAIGGYFGARLIEAGANVTFLVRSPRAEQLARDGLIVESRFGNFRRQVTIATSGTELAPPDVIIVACKSYSLAGVLQAIAPCTGPGTIILPLLNGVAHLEAIEKQLPDAAIWGGVAHIGVTLTPDGIVKHLNDLHSLTFGAWHSSDRLQEENFLTAFEGSPVDAKLSRNIVQDLWAKLIFLATLAGSTCLMRADIGTILGTAHGEQYILGLLSECGAIADAEGYPPNADQAEWYRLNLTERGSTSTASMLRDIEAGRPTEVEHIFGDLVARAAKHGIPARLLEIAHSHLQAYEARRM